MNTPSGNLSRVLRSLGLRVRKDFTIRGHWVAGVREYDYCHPSDTQACAVMIEHADAIEAATSRAGTPFAVSIRYSGGTDPFVVIANGPARSDRVRETPGR